ncbi:MAG: DegT/DnrJ/EryC1/StrS family aminotransferase [Chloroflexi bacterium]|nr:DegT/DnrJ/EryC1/StrS family aminotransferase [Chloroflexota bacterium]
MNIPLARPDITDLEKQYVMDVLSTPNLSLGPKLEEFERGLAEWAGVEYAVAVNSGTSALHLIVRAMGIGPGDEVITTPFSFIASANCVLYEGATPVFVDIDGRTLNIDAERIEGAITGRTKAIVAVDVFGQPAEWDRLREIADRHGLRLIEDSAESIGAEYRGRRAGGLGDAGIFSFYPNKQITTGEGGAVLTNDPDIARLCRSMRNQGRSDDGGWLQHTRLGYNYRISDINCALGLAQLQRLPEILEARARVAEMYDERLRDVEGIETPFTSPDVKRSWFVYVARLSEQYDRQQRDSLVSSLRSDGIGCGIYFPPIHQFEFYREMLEFGPADFPVSTSIGARTIALPFHNRLTEPEVDTVVSTLTKHMKALAAAPYDKLRTGIAV